MNLQGRRDSSAQISAERRCWSRLGPPDTGHRACGRTAQALRSQRRPRLQEGRSPPTRGEQRVGVGVPGCASCASAESHPGPLPPTLPGSTRETRYLSPWVPRRRVQSLQARPFLSFLSAPSSRTSLFRMTLLGGPTDLWERLNPKPHFTDEGTEAPPSSALPPGERIRAFLPPSCPSLPRSSLLCSVSPFWRLHTPAPRRQRGREGELGLFPF